MKLEFSGNKALITGGTSELAIKVAEYMKNSGVYPILTCRNEKGRKKIESAMNSSNGFYGIEHLDLSDAGSIQALFDKPGFDIDYLVDIAHGDYEKLIASAGIDDIYKYFSENISFRAELIKTAARSMLKKKRGRLLFISSTACNKSNPGQGFYTASKLASEALYRNLGLELADHGITTVTLRTAYIESGRGKRYYEKHKEKVISQMPAKRILSCNEVAESIIFLLSESASGFNAVEINLDGGFAKKK